MLPALRVAAAALAAGLTVAGCSAEVFTYTLSRYGEVRGVHVRLGCDDTYEVFDRPDTSSFIVVTNGVNEALASCGDRASVPKDARMARIARIFLDETSARPQCRIVRQAELTPLHTEVTYQCGAGGASAPRRTR